MLVPLNTAKIRAEHLDLSALVYVRQSTFMQVRRNTSSTARQYDMRHRVAPGPRPSAERASNT